MPAKVMVCQNRVRERRLNLIGSFVIAFSMLHAFRCRMDWTEERMRYAFVFSADRGGDRAVEIATFALCEILGAGVLFRTCLLTAVPLLITGGIHMDGISIDGCAPFLRRAGKKAGDFKRSPYGGVCDHRSGAVPASLCGGSF